MLVKILIFKNAAYLLSASAEAYLRLCYISMLELLSETSERLLAVHYCCKKLHHKFLTGP